MSEPYEGDYRCEASEGYEKSDRCVRVATQVRREPYTPGRFAIMFCDEHADPTYELDAEATEKLRRDVEKVCRSEIVEPLVETSPANDWLCLECSGVTLADLMEEGMTEDDYAQNETEMRRLFHGGDQ